MDVRTQDRETRRNLQRKYGLFAVEEPQMQEQVQATESKKKTQDPALRTLEGMKDAFEGMEKSARRMAEAQEYTYWGVVKHSLKVCSVVIPIAAVSLFGTLWAAKRVL